MTAPQREILTDKNIERQISLPWRRSLIMVRNSIFIRLGRSAITASGIFLGIAFLTSVLASSAILRGMASLGIAEQEFGESEQARAVWLVSMSLLVATVGIVNSMLMAVTERYKEIGTMKCLGALDTFIVRLFLLESGILGLIGAAVGAGVGYVGVSLVHMVRFGPKVWSHVGPALLFGGGAFSVSLPVAVVGAVILGALLALLAAIYPAWRASLMPPAAALRVEI